MYRHGFIGEWMEPKLLTIYVVNEQGKKIRTSAIPITNDGTYSGYKEFLKILEMYLVNLGISEAKQVLLIADGAEWIWIHIPPLLKKIKCPLETYQLLDFYHAASHLQDFADAAFSTNNERQQWFKKSRKTQDNLSCNYVYLLSINIPHTEMKVLAIALFLPDLTKSRCSRHDLLWRWFA